MHSALFDSLTADEISRASTLSEISRASLIIKKHGIGGDRPGFGSLFVDEPDKTTVRAGAAVNRRARAMVLDRTSAATWNVVVDLDDESIVSSHQLTDGSAQMLFEEVQIIDEAAKSDPRFGEALAKRGITDLSLVQIDPFGVGNRADLDLAGKRLWAGVTYFRHAEDDNAYAHIVEGVIVLVDTVTREVVGVEDTGVRPMPMTCGNYTADHNQPMRTDVAPLEITQPNGPGFVLDGPQMTWQKWRFASACTPSTVSC